MKDNDIRYDDFEKLAKLTKLVRLDKDSFCKFIQRGDLIVWDYDRGFIDLHGDVYEYKEAHWINIYFGTIDDCDWRGYIEKGLATKKEAQALLEKLATHFEDMIKFPDLEELRKQLAVFGVLIEL